MIEAARRIVYEMDRKTGFDYLVGQNRMESLNDALAALDAMKGDHK